MRRTRPCGLPLTTTTSPTPRASTAASTSTLVEECLSCPCRRSIPSSGYITATSIGCGPCGRRLIRVCTCSPSPALQPSRSLAMARTPSRHRSIPSGTRTARSGTRTRSRGPRTSSHTDTRTRRFRREGRRKVFVDSPVGRSTGCTESRRQATEKLPLHSGDLPPVQLEVRLSPILVVAVFCFP